MAKNTMIAALLLVSYLTLAAAAAAAPGAAQPKPPPIVTKEYHVAVEGTVYCKSCKLPGYNKALDASPINGAVAKLRCNLKPNSPAYEVAAKTDKNGYFFIAASEKLSSLDYDKCRVFLVSSPLAFCRKPTDVAGGVTGARLAYQRNVQIGATVYSVYAAGAFQFAPTTPKACPVY